VLQDQRERDARDAARAIAPMIPADDATVIDTTGLSIEGVVDLLARDIEKHLGEPASSRGDAGRNPW
jgi:cytidylate kinase